jgi:hypothetical protein
MNALSRGIRAGKSELTEQLLSISAVSSIEVGFAPLARVTVGASKRGMTTKRRWQFVSSKSKR